jgi:hypothetical protein
MWTVRQLHATRTQDLSGLNYELEKTSDKPEELGTLQTDRGDLADGPLGVNQHSSRNNPKLLINGSPKPLGVLRQKFGEMNTQREDMP